MQHDKKSIENKLQTIKYNCSSKTHLVINQEVCKKCKAKPCCFICPADVYSYDENSKEIIVQYENCLECGSCRIVCQADNIKWNYPDSGCGVVYKNS